MMPPRNILLFHLGALGDFVLTWPLALALSRIHPQSRIIYVTHPQKGALAERVLGVESTSIEAGWHHLYSDAAELPAPALKFLTSSHSIYTFLAGPNDGWSQNVHRLAPHADLCCLDPRPADPTRHVTENLLAQLAGRPAVAGSVTQMLSSINTRALAFPSRTPHPASSSLITLHPGSGSVEKCWPAENFLELARCLRSAGHPVRILLGDVERDRWPASQIDAFASVAELYRPQTYLDLLSSLADTSLFLGNDSGPSHLAGILGIPTFCLFGPTDPIVWHPLGPHVHTLHHPFPSLPIDQVLTWITPPKKKARA
ncbi:MAG: glycosyltransferase family 9 protein [Bacillota bacterium]